MIDLLPQDLSTIKRVLAKHVPGCEVRAFGSRVTWTAKEHSDLDLAIIGKEKLSRSLLSLLKDEFEDSAIPVKVDLLDWHRISPEFQKNITKQYKTIQQPHEGNRIPEDWTYRKVVEIAEVIGGGTPKTKRAEYWGGDIPWLTPKDLSGEHPRYVSHGERDITKAGLENSSARIVPPKTVLLTSRAPVGYVALAKNPITTNQGFRSLVVNNKNDPEFVYYLLLNNTDYLKQHAAGSTFQEISGSTLKSFEFLFPPLPEQRAIAHILGSLDDKIELNRRMNQTLEAMARAIFKSWFMDFDPVRAKAQGSDSGLPHDIAALFPDSFEDSELGEIPMWWRTTTLGDLFPSDRDCVLTGPFGSKLHSYDYRDEGVPLLLVKHIIDGKIMEDDIPLVGFHKTPELDRYRLNIGDIVFTRVGAVGRSAYIHPRYENWLFSGQTLRVRIPCREVLNPRYLSQIYLEPSFIAMVESHALGSTRPSLNTRLLNNFRFLLAPIRLQEVWSQYVSPLDRMIQNNNDQNRALSSLRETLLPKLISGELRVPDAEKFAEEAGI
jgi:type I restriction enzyme S subunit